MHPVILYVAAAITGIWGVAHLFATRGVVAEFGDLMEDNRRVITISGFARSSSASQQS